MTTPGEPQALPFDPSPALLRDERGRSILPTEQLPGVDFGAHLDKGKGDGSYFPPRAAHESGESQEPPPVESKDDESTLKGLQRSRTAPTHDLQRPKPPARTSTLLGGLRRQYTGARVNEKVSDPYPYTFDSLSSDSSSSSEDEMPAAGERLSRRHTDTDGGTNASDQKRKHQEKQGRSYSRFNIGNEHYRSKGRVSKRDGRLNISVNETANNGVIAKALGHSIKNHLDIPHGRQPRKQRRYESDHPSLDPNDVVANEAAIPEHLRSHGAQPRLNIVIMVIGSRGDIQPFLKIGKILKHEYGHRVRIATHPTFREFVEKDIGLEFFSIGGDPSELMAFMVKNPGLIPSVRTIREGEIHRRRVAMGEMFEGMWRATVNAIDNEQDQDNVKLISETYPFVADAIIANPPSMAHVHIAEKLGIPLHIMFTFPYSPTQQFPHPLANIRAGKSNVDANYVNFMSYPLVEMMTWQGLGDIVNRFRERTLKLEPVSSLWAPGALYRMKVPYTYMWSPTLIPKPSDWGPEINVSGFVFLDLAQKFEPPEDLSNFLNAGEPPVYIGFGSIVVDDPEAFTEMIFEAVKLAGVRALVNKGWGGLGRDGSNTPDNIFMIGNVPHDWLFPRVKAVVHHGGAGTTAIGLKCAKPTMVVPFFGDQSFWAARLVEAKAGAHEVIPWKKLTAELFAEGIKQCLTEEAQQNVQILADSIANEGDGAENAVKCFHRCLPFAGRYNMRCTVLENRSAAWVLKGTSLRLSPLAAELLMQRGRVKPHDLTLFRTFKYGDFDGPGEPFTGGVGALADSVTEMGAGVGMVPVRVAKHIRKRQDHERRKEEIQKRKEERQQRKAAQARQPEPPIGDSGSGSQRPAPERENTTNTMDTNISADPTEPLAAEVAGDIGHGLKQTGTALLTMPNDLHVAIAQGFHNAPRLWGDATVRKPVRITGFKSGCVAARKELVYGAYDGFTGLVTQPVAGFREGDTVPSKMTGLGTGMGKGVGGFVLKNLSAIVSPPAYICKGSIVYVKKKSEGPGSKADVRKARFIQGRKDFRALMDSDDPKDKEELKFAQDKIEEGWKVYEAVWELYYKRFGAVGGGVISRFKLGRERRKWQEAGVFENMRTTKKALEAEKAGEDLDEHFAQRREEQEAAERRRRGTIDTPDREGDVAPMADPIAESSDANRQLSVPSVRKQEPTPDGDNSDTTCVASSEDEDDKNKGGVMGQVNVDGGDDMLKKVASGLVKPTLGKTMTA